MRVGSQHQDLGNLLRYHATQRHQRFAQQFEGTRSFPEIQKRGGDTFTRSDTGTHGAHHLRSQAPNLHGSTYNTPRGALSAHQVETMKAKESASQGIPLDQGLAPSDPAPTSGETQSTTPRTYSQTDIENLLKIFGAVKGDESFDDTMDMNADGKIDVDDLNQMLSNSSPAEPQPAEARPTTYTQDDINNLQEIFGAVQGDEAFDGSMDMNGDGKIDVDDLNHMLSNIEESDEG